MTQIDLNTRPLTTALNVALKTVETPTEKTPANMALFLLRRACEKIVAEGDLDTAKASLTSKHMLNLPGVPMLTVFNLARCALVEARAAAPRPGKGETPRYFALLMAREEISLNLFSGPVPDTRGKAILAAVGAYHALAAIERFSQPEAAEPQTVEAARVKLDAQMARPELSALTEPERAELQTAYDDSLF